MAYPGDLPGLRGGSEAPYMVNSEVACIFNGILEMRKSTENAEKYVKIRANQT
jgi:hypothetical protein